MKVINQLTAILFLGAFLISACKKDETKVMYNGGKAPVLTASANAVNLTADDSLKEVVTFSWTDPAYTLSTGKSTLEVTYTLEIDSAGKNFTKPESFNQGNVLKETFTGAEFNAVLLKMGFRPDSTYKINVRIQAALYVEMTRLLSNVLTLTVRPYLAKPKPKYAPPATLFIVGDATPGDWTNPVSVPSQQLTQLDENTFGAILQLTAGKNYVFLPDNGSWSHKYAVADNTIPAAQTGTDFLVDAGRDIPAPATSGLYKIIVDFLTGKYSVTPVTAADEMVPAALFIVGDATPGDWTNPVPVPSQQFIQKTNGGYELTLNLVAGKHYVLLPQNGSWTHKYAVPNNTIAAAQMGGSFNADAGKDFPSPDVSGNYKIEVQFITKTYKLTKL